MIDVPSSSFTPVETAFKILGMDVHGRKVEFVPTSSTLTGRFFRAYDCAYYEMQQQVQKQEVA